MMFTLSAGINCFIILKLYFFCITLISFDKCEHFCKLTARMVPLGIPRWPIHTYLRHVHVLDHGHFTDIVGALTI
jgi:hypothetical protein